MDPVVILATDNVILAAGDSAQVAARVMNRGRRVESYRVDVVGDAAGFATVEPATVSVLPGREQQVLVTFTAPGGPSATPGTHRFGVRAVSDVDPTASALAEGRLELGGIGGVLAWVPETVASGRWSGRYRLQLENRGNAGVRLAVTAHDPTGELRLSVVPDAVDLLPGTPTSTGIEAKARKPYLRGTPVSRTVQVATHDFPFGAERPIPGAAPNRDDPHHHQFQLTFEQRPILSKWVIVIAAVLLIAIVAFVVWRLFGGSEVELEAGEPFTPVDLTATPLGQSEVALAWLAVPNAASYEVWESEADGTTLADAEAAPTEEARTTVADLEPASEHCYKVRSIGFDEQRSDFTDPVCAATDPVTEIPPPADLSASAVGADGTIVLSWTYPPEAVELIESYTVIVDNQEQATAVSTGETQMSTPIVAEPGPAERQVEVRVRAEATDGARSPASEPLVVTVPALPPPSTTTSPPTTAVPGGTGGDGNGGGNGDGNGDGNGGGNGGGNGATTAPTSTSTTTSTTSSTTTAPTTSTTLAPQGSLELDPQPVEAPAVLVPFLGEGGLAADQLRAELAAATGASLEQIRSFNNRDKFVPAKLDADPPTADQLSGVGAPALPPDEIFFYAIVADDAAATAGCAAITGPCEPVRLRSAGVEGAAVREVGRRPIDTPIDELDPALVDARGILPTRSVHLIDGRDWAQFDAEEWIIVALVSGPGDELCSSDSCVTLTPSGG